MSINCSVVNRSNQTLDLADKNDHGVKIKGRVPSMLTPSNSCTFLIKTKSRSLFQQRWVSSSLSIILSIRSERGKKNALFDMKIKDKSLHFEVDVTTDFESKPMRVIWTIMGGKDDSDVSDEALNIKPAVSKSKQESMKDDQAIKNISGYLAADEGDLKTILEQSKKEFEDQEKNIADKERLQMEWAIEQSKLENSPDTIRQKSWENLQTAMDYLVSGKFREAESPLNDGMDVLLNFPDAYNQFKDEIIFASLYAQTIHILKEITIFQKKDLFRQAGWVLSRVADIPIQPEHRIVIVRAAIKANFLLGNFGFAARYLDLIIATPFPDSDQLQEMLEVCKQENFINHNSPEDSPGLLMCYSTCRIIKRTNYFYCDICGATYHPLISQITCSFCRSKLQLTTR
eukprot:TRINITY_DN3010_c0_g1_i2.p1 TRINITY_DN3010_c0_g1~~TRINITY_DN3010_c0_g1_i2.p1  ORF type:complete len:401 (-),score=76.41 TRINITY_DN3010_c0_g1_i2:12-1214(-)